MNQFQKQIKGETDIRDNLLIDRISVIFDAIRDKSRLLAMEVIEKSEDKDNYFSEYNRSDKLAKQINEELRPSYLAKDKFMQQAYINEYPTAYIQSLYTVDQLGRSKGYNVRLPKYTEKQFKQAINYPLSKLMNNAKMKTGRSLDIEQLYSTIVNGVEQGLSLPKINKNLDIALGYRDAQTGKWIGDISERKGQQYKTMRILRTEVLRMRSTAETDQWLNSQSIVPSKLQIISVLDNRTRPQSAQIDGQYSNEKGQFFYPNGLGWKYPHRTGRASVDINDREDTITVDIEFPPESRIQRDKDGNSKVLPFEDFKSYSEKLGMKTNKYGQVLFP